MDPFAAGNCGASSYIPQVLCQNTLHTRMCGVRTFLGQKRGDRESSPYACCLGACVLTVVVERVQVISTSHLVTRETYMASLSNP